MTVDLVYLWVDGADPAWQRKRTHAYTHWIDQNPDALAVHGNTAGRYRDNGELRFNLRALEAFFPHHGHIYIVTDGQSPDWLRPSQGLTVVDHRALMPRGTTGVFDSGHIESYLHHIEGLSERFIYLNDDVFFGAPVDLDWWFCPHPKVFIETTSVTDFETLQPQATALVNASILSRQWMGSQYPGYKHDSRVFSHAPRPMLKSAMYVLEGLAPELFAQVRSTVFRSWQVPAIVPDLVPRWMVHSGYAVQRTLDPLHIRTGDPDAKTQLQYLVAHWGQLPFFCINDTCDDALDEDPRLLRIAHTLESLLPVPSSFEWVN